MKNKMKFLAIYLCWSFIHIMFYVISLDSACRIANERFLPFCSFRSGYYIAGNGYPKDFSDYLLFYDITELLVYLILPLLIAFLYFAFKPTVTENTKKAKIDL
jgi:hypothetical protein